MDVCEGVRERERMYVRNPAELLLAASESQECPRKICTMQWGELKVTTKIKVQGLLL